MRWAPIVCLVALAPAAAPSSLEEVLTGFYAAQGGLKNLKATASVRISGTYQQSGAPEEPLLLEWKRPDRLRLAIGDPGREAVELFDGEAAWLFPPGGSSPERASGAEALGIRRAADLIDGPLVDWQTKGNTVTFLGPGELDGVAVLKLGLVEAGGIESTVFLDATSLLPIRRRGTTELQGTDTDVEIFFRDYRPVDGLMIAHTVRTELTDLGVTQWFRIETFEANVEIPDARFSVPARAAQP